jgi:hypothetical protein
MKSANWEQVDEDTYNKLKCSKAKSNQNLLITEWINIREKTKFKNNHLNHWNCRDYF